MTYQALIESLGGRFHIPFDGNINYNTFGWPQFISATVSQNFNTVYVNDAPAGLGTTQSIRVGGNPSFWNGTTVNIPRYRLSVSEWQNPPYNNQGHTITMWIKQGNVTAGSNIPVLTILFNKENNSSSDWDETFSLTGGTWNNYITQSSNLIRASCRVRQFTPVTTVLVTSNHEFPNDDQWHNLTYVHRWGGVNNVQGATWEGAWFLDGILVAYQYQPGDGIHRGWGKQSDGGYVDTITAGHSQTSPNTPYRQVSNYTIFDRPLSVAEIRQIAWYNKPEMNYTDVVLADNPLYFAPLNNVDNTVDTEVFGTNAATWGPLNDTGLTAGVEGVLGRAWLIPNSTTVAADTTTAAMMSGLDSVITGPDSHTIEFWLKCDLKPTATMNILTMRRLAANNATYRFDLRSDGDVSATFPTRTGASSYSTSTVRISFVNTSIDMPAANSDFYSDSVFSLYDLLPFDRNNWLADNQWHHIALVVEKDKTFSSPTGGFRYNYQIYVDGMNNQSTATNTNGQIQSLGPLDFFRLGRDLSSQSSREISVDKIAIYPYALPAEKLINHIIAGKFLIESNQGAVKYWDGDSWNTSSAQKVWNGTEWIDWDHRYWNGTEWITL